MHIWIGIKQGGLNMEKLGFSTTNCENTLYQKTEYSNLASRLEEKEIPLEAENQETDKLDKLEIWNKDSFVGIPILAITFAEILIYFGKVSEALWIHTITLMGLSLSTKFIKNEDSYKTYQALMLLPLLRLVNLSMPVFFDTALYSFILIYTTMAILLAITITYQQLTSKDIGITFKRMWLYLPFSVLISLALALGEYMIIKPGYLISDLSPLNILKLTVIMVFFVGLIEEVIFRSILQTRLNMIFGERGGILLSSILFGLMHFGYQTFYEVLYVSFVGAILGYLFYKTRSLPLIALIHGFTNVFLFGVIPHLSSGI
jgi:CAAX amino terminal protease family.